MEQTSNITTTPLCTIPRVGRSFFHLISSHIDIAKLEEVEDVDTICLFTGQRIAKGIHRKTVIKTTFTDLEFLKFKSEYVSLDVASTMANILPGKTRPVSLRNYSFIATEKELRLLRNSEILPHLTSPPDPPFYFCISFNNKKHLAFKATPNFDRERFLITTDFGDCLVEKSDVDAILPVIRKWYTVIPEKADTKAEPTYFTKDEILKGSKNYKRIESYPGNYFQEDQFIRKYRGTMLLKILVHALIKTTDYVES